jgi:hypothetical protein
MDCPICRDHNVSEDNVDGLDGVFRLNCRRCGVFVVKSSFLIENPRSLSDEEVGKISGYVFEHPDKVFEGRDWDLLLNLRMPSIGDKAEKLLSYLGKKYPKPNQAIEFNGSGQELAASYSVDRDEANLNRPGF